MTPQSSFWGFVVFKLHAKLSSRTLLQSTGCSESIKSLNPQINNKTKNKTNWQCIFFFFSYFTMFFFEDMLKCFLVYFTEFNSNKSMCVSISWKRHCTSWENLVAHKHDGLFSRTPRRSSYPMTSCSQTAGLNEWAVLQEAASLDFLRRFHVNQ